jgi:hypothetical protein
MGRKVAEVADERHRHASKRVAADGSGWYGGGMNKRNQTWFARIGALTLGLAVAVSACDDAPADTAQSEDVAAPSDAAASDASSGDAAADAVDATEISEPGPNDCVHAGTDAATARCMAPTFPPEYYVSEALAYFDTLDIDADRESIPNYAPRVARWEWDPWLLLTGYEDVNMIETAAALRRFDPSTVPVRDCRFFEQQPFARCFVEFEYEEGPCPIYEEFVFDDEGEMTFIEAWSDLPDLLPQDASDRWADAADYPRLSTRIPGLGAPGGEIAFESEAMAALIASDPVVADFVERTKDFWGTWFQVLADAPSDFFAIGCGW